jgi:DnaJ like chaperone protein
MSVWNQIGEFLSSITIDAFSGVVEAVRSTFEGDPETRRQVAFSVAVIALSAKMAKADGVVTSDEIDAFRDIFQIPENEARNVTRLYNLAKQDVAGFASYAQQVSQMFRENKTVLEDVMDGLYHIAKADGLVHDKEQAFLDTVADIFGISERVHERIKLRHLHPYDGNPYELLEADPGWDNETLKSH